MADNLNRLRMAHERYRQSETDRRQTDGRATANSERERTRRSLQAFRRYVSTARRFESQSVLPNLEHPGRPDNATAVFYLISFYCFLRQRAARTLICGSVDEEFMTLIVTPSTLAATVDAVDRDSWISMSRLSDGTGFKLLTCDPTWSLNVLKIKIFWSSKLRLMA